MKEKIYVKVVVSDKKEHCECCQCSKKLYSQMNLCGDCSGELEREMD